MSLLFSEEEFQSAWTELDEPQLDGGWELFTESMGVKIYRLYDQDTGLYEYKVFGVLDSCPPELCADVYMDLDYRKQWDGYVKELHQDQFEGRPAVYWQVKYPFPLSNRDYVYVRERRDLDLDGRRIWVILAHSSPETPCAERSGVLRVRQYRQSVAMETDGARGAKVFMRYFDNPGGMIPAWLVNWAAKSGVPNFLTDMQKACSNYAAYCQRK
ncbi:phosphatidylcholine transfer protein [Salarias fasciatus]|uniref:Phosphatidylcholine transfer protein n=1 Tax=Salarias fasciatus TaxID=181472 RepID=A0A672HZ94_SALFA|nr:phosphatidylcholine transfer protein [Salarias fasciatus]